MKVLIDLLNEKISKIDTEITSINNLLSEHKTSLQLLEKLKSTEIDVSIVNEKEFDEIFLNAARSENEKEKVEMIKSFIANGLFRSEYLQNEIFSQSIYLKRYLDDLIFHHENRIKNLSHEAEEKRTKIEAQKEYIVQKLTALSNYNENSLFGEEMIEFISGVLSEIDSQDYKAVVDLLFTLNKNNVKILSKKSERIDFAETPQNSEEQPALSIQYSTKESAFKPEVEAAKQKKTKEAPSVSDEELLSVNKKRLKLFIDRFKKTAEILKVYPNGLPISNVYSKFIEKLEKDLSDNKVLNEENSEIMFMYMGIIDPKELIDHVRHEEDEATKNLLRCLVIHQFVKKIKAKNTINELYEYFYQLMYGELENRYLDVNYTEKDLSSYLKQCGQDRLSAYVDKLIKIKGQLESNKKNVDFLANRYKNSSFKLEKISSIENGKFNFSGTTYEENKENIDSIFGGLDSYLSAATYHTIEDFISTIRDYKLSDELLGILEEKKIFLDACIRSTTIENELNKEVEPEPTESAIYDSVIYGSEKDTKNYVIFLDAPKQKKVFDMYFDSKTKTNGLSKIHGFTLTSLNDIYSNGKSMRIKSSQHGLQEYQGGPSRVAFKVVNEIQYKGKNVILISLMWGMNQKNFNIRKASDLYDAQVRRSKSKTMSKLEEDLIKEFKNNESKLLESKIAEAVELCNYIKEEEPRTSGKARERDEK